MKFQFYQYFRERLPEDQKSIYDKLFSQWMNMEPRVSIGIITERNISKLTEYLLLDNPAIFYVNYYSYIIEKRLTNQVLHMNYFCSKEEARTVLEKMNVWIEQVRYATSTFRTSWDKVIKIYDLLGATIKYGKTEDFRQQTLEGAVMDHQAVCEGISKAFKFLCDSLGIPCIIVVGKSGLSNGHKEPHAWNMIKIGDEWGHVDLTFDITACFRIVGELSHSRVFLSDETMTDYCWDKTEYPRCSTKNADWYGKNNLIVHSKERIQSIIGARKNNGSKMVCFKIDDTMGVDEKRLQALLSSVLPYGGYKYIWDKQTQAVMLFY